MQFFLQIKKQDGKMGWVRKPSCSPLIYLFQHFLQINTVGFRLARRIRLVFWLRTTNPLNSTLNSSELSTAEKAPQCQKASKFSPFTKKNPKTFLSVLKVSRVRSYLNWYWVKSLSKITACEGYKNNSVERSWVFSTLEAQWYHTIILPVVSRFDLEK